ncbi:MAG: TRAM domain-containing protein [Clostridiales bacterium]|jgi:23S rRNA (uracil1939-C5)-methyltransferase|nr:TRAM domain-containing protein [Clostridiales bacterium]
MTESVHEVTVTAVTPDGQGIARLADGMVVFIPGALPGERVTARIRSLGKKSARASLVDIVQPSPDRVVPPCPSAGDCGGCPLSHMRAAAQHAFKVQEVEAALTRIGGVPAAAAVPQFFSAAPLGYRNKITLAVAGGRVGYRNEVDGHLVEIEDCCLFAGNAGRMLAALRAAGLPCGVEHAVLGCYGQGKREGIVLCGVGKAPDAAALTALLPDVALYYHRKPHADRRAFVPAGRTRLLAGTPLPVGPEAFHQINEAVADMLYAQVERSVCGARPRGILDAYCGAGALSVRLSRYAPVYGVEIDKRAVEEATARAREKKANATFLAADCAVGIAAVADKCDVAVLDPPRGGCGKGVTAALLKSNLRRLVYVSCHPATLARDLAVLRKRYGVTAVYAYDMFPQTGHVETLAVLEKIIHNA